MPDNRPFKAYEGQRVSPVPEGFLNAYAQIGQNLASSGQTLGKGIVEAVAAFKESEAKAGALKSTFNSLAPRLNEAIKVIDDKIAAYPPDVRYGSDDPTAQSEDNIIFRALQSTREDLVSGIGKFEDMSNSKKEQWLGSAANLIKYSEEESDRAAKAAGTAFTQKVESEKLKLAQDAEARLKQAAGVKEANDLRPIQLTDAFNAAINRGKNDSTEAQRGSSYASRIAENTAIVEAAAKETDPEKKKQLFARFDRNIAVNNAETDALQADKKYVLEATAQQQVKTKAGAEQLLTILKEQRASLLSGNPEILSLFEKDAGILVNEKVMKSIPAPIRKELTYVQGDIKALEESLAPKKGADGKPVKEDKNAEFVFTPPSATLKAQAFVARRRAQESYMASSQLLGYTPSAQELEWLGDLVEYDGTTTDDGYKISIDPKTGRIEAKQDEEWVKFNAKNPLLHSPQERDAALKRQQELNQISYQQNKLVMGTTLPNGEQRARRWVYDERGENSVYVRGTMLVDDKKATEVHNVISDANEEQGALGQIIRLISKKNADGTFIQRKDSKGVALEINGQLVPEVKKWDEMSEAEQRQLSVTVANFIRVRAKSLGVLSKQDWAYLDTLIPNLTTKFASNIQAGESIGSLLPQVTAYFISQYTRDTDSIVNGAVTLGQGVRQRVVDTLKSIPAAGTPTGKLEVIGGLARYQDTTPLLGQPLSRWYETALTADYDQQNEKDDLRTKHAEVKNLWLTRNASKEAMELFKKSALSYKAYLFSRGITQAQWEQISKEYFAN